MGIKLETTNIEGAFFIQHDSYLDERGSFYEIANQDILVKTNFPLINKVNISKSNFGVLRGLHYQIKEPQLKLISCIKGKIIDFAVDVRKDSNTFGQVIQLELNEDKPESLFLPLGVAHGFLSLSETSEVLYLVSGTYRKDLERGIDYKSLDLILPIEPTLINERDLNWPRFKEAEYC